MKRAAHSGSFQTVDEVKPKSGYRLIGAFFMFMTRMLQFSWLSCSYFMYSPYITARTDGIALHQCLFIDNQMKFQIQEFGCLPAEQHPLHEDFKVFADLAVSGVDHEL